MTGVSDPSATRRKALRDADSKNIIKVIDSYPVEKYYVVTDRLLQEFHHALDERRLDDAYVYGIRFATFSIESLPKHKNYKHLAHGSLRLRNARQVDQVLKKLESVTARMDAEDLVAQRRERQVQEDHEHRPQEVMTNNTRETEGRDNRNDLEQRAKDKLRELQLKSDQEFVSKQSRVLGVFRSKKDNERSTVSTISQRAKVNNANSKAAISGDLKSVGDILEQERSRLRDEAERLARQKREEEAVALAQERKRLNEEADRLAQHWARQQQENKASEEAEIMNMAVREAAAAIEEQRLQDLQDEIELKQLEDKAADVKAAQDLIAREHERKRQVALHAGKIDGSRPHLESLASEKSSSRPLKSTYQSIPTVASLTPKVESPYKLPPMTQEETRTIEVLRTTIAKQESVLASLEERQENRILLREAKAKLDSGDRKGALRCLALKKKLDGRIDALKGAIFTMETQIILLESAVENRHVSKAMQAATEAMQSLHVDMDSVNLDDMNHAMADFANALANDEMFDEDELLSELQGSSDVDVVDQHSLLSLPSVPTAQIPVAEPSKGKDVQKETIMASWF